MSDFLVYYLLRVLGPLVRSLPSGLVFFIGRRLGDLAWCFDLKHRLRAYSHIKTAFGSERTPGQLRGICRDFYRSFGENAAEMLLIPKMDRDYIRRNVRIHGLEHVQEAFGRGKGVILVAMHAGGWEIANIICASLGFPFSMFVREQKWPRVEKLLNAYRCQKGCRLIKREDEVRQLLRVLKANEATVLTIDQGGKNGTNVSFLGKDASMASGAVRLALKYDAALVPVFPVRVKNSRVDFYVEPAFTLSRSGDEKRDLQDNLQALVRIFEGFIRRWPQSYLWTYRIWKYARQKEVLIISDGKAGHLRQSQALAAEVCAFYRASQQRRAERAQVRTVTLAYRHPLGRAAMAAAGCLSGKYICQGCLRCLEALLAPSCFRELTAVSADVVISAGSAAAPVNYLIARENQAKSLVVMRPALQPLNRFDAVIMPRHDLVNRTRPRLPGNVLVVDGALNLIDEAYLRDNLAALQRGCGYLGPQSRPVIGILLGGESAHFSLTPRLAERVLRQVKAAAEAIDADVLVTTSRRTSVATEQAVKREMAGYGRCKLLIIANEKNYPFAVGGILAASDIAVVSPESISMVSEAASSKAYTLVFAGGRQGRRHEAFLEGFSRRGFIALEQPEALSSRIENIWYNRPHLMRPDNRSRIQQLLGRIL